jgi:hypothetical protein
MGPAGTPALRRGSNSNHACNSNLKSMRSRLQHRPRVLPARTLKGDATVKSRFMAMALVSALSLGLAACGSTPGGRALSGGLLGAGAGAGVSAATGGSVGTGALIGGGVGAAGGALTAPSRRY